MIPRWIPFAALCLSACGYDSSLPPTGFAAGHDEVRDAPFLTVWQGFEHAWTHNHRWNRFGSWAAPTDCAPGQTCWGLAHAAASGTSADTASIRTMATTVDADQLGFAQISAEVQLDLSFGATSWRRAATATIFLDQLPAAQASALRDRPLTTWLNGFDVGAAEGSKAAKPVDLLVEAGEARYDPTRDAIDVDWRSFLQLGCSSEECALRKQATYTVRVELAIAASDTPLAIGPPVILDHTYAWDAPPHLLGHGHARDAGEVEPTPVSRHASVPADLTAVPAFKRLSMHLFQWDDRVRHADQHMLAWRSTIRADRSDADEVRVEADLMFKNWTDGMRRHQAFAYEEVGAASMTAEVILLALPSGGVERSTWTAGHSWRGKEAPAHGEDAVTRTIAAGGAR